VEVCDGGNHKGAMKTGVSVECRDGCRCECVTDVGVSVQRIKIRCVMDTSASACGYRGECLTDANTNVRMEACVCDRRELECGRTQVECVADGSMDKG
jgi:hypothetical protein